MGLPYNLITLANSAYQFVPGGYMSINGKTYNLHSSTTGASGGWGDTGGSQMLLMERSFIVTLRGRA